MISRQKLGQKLKEFRKDLGMTQGDLATIAHTGTATISQYERGITHANILPILRICEHFRITVEDLLGLDIKKKLTLP